MSNPLCEITEDKYGMYLNISRYRNSFSTSTTVTVELLNELVKICSEKLLELEAKDEKVK